MPIQRPAERILRGARDNLDGLIAWWPFVTNSGEDVSGLGNMGALVAAPGVTAGPARTTGLLLNGSTQYVTTTTNFGNASSITTISQSVWFKTTSVTGQGLICLNQFQDGTDGTFDRQMYVGTNGQVHGYLYDGAAKQCATTPAYNDGFWHHAVNVIEAGVSMRLYVDGALQASIGIGTPYTGYGSSFWSIARSATISGADSASGTFNGSIADVRVYNKALTPGEIHALYNMKYAELQLRPDEWEMPALFVAAAGGAFQVAWAANSNVMIQSGARTA